ncbi:MAG: ABC transporter substrate-binding protein [Desulfobacteraceae bacterium]|nr:ABC transporter substrate-binding protein [Desulfobacteraceae bacterium]
MMIILSILAIACLLITTPAISESEKNTYKIGGIFAVTGPASFLGDPEKKSMEMVVDQINASGGIDGHMLEAVIYDTEGDPGKANLLATKLINKDNVIAIIGPSTTPTTLAVMPIIQRIKIPFISCAAGNKIVAPINPWVFKTAQSDILAVAAIYENLKSKKIKKISIISVNNAFGESGKEQLLSQAKNFGLTVAKSETYGAKDTDMTAQLTKIRKDNPEAIVCWGTNPGPAVLAKNMQQLDLNIPLFQSHGVASPKFIELAGSAAEGIMLPTGKILVASLLSDSDPQKEMLTAYISEYKNKYKSSVSGFGGYAYDAANILAAALKNSEGDKEKIREALENTEGYVGVSGIFNFSKTDHNGLSPEAFVMVKIKDGKWELLK